MDAILGTAGHIDHGKTTLVRALTGIDCDRLEEEKRRGITIELGFAWLDLPNGRKLGIVDVPGHERFVKNMVAGASGVDCVLLVVAADEGIMPQTREHLEICSLLGVRSGLVALTKTDLVDEEWLQFVTGDIQKSLAGTFLAHAPIVPVSAATGSGIENLRKLIAAQIAATNTAARSDIFRLPMDRVFSMKGFGTVVTGTITSGACSAGEKLCVMPENLPTRARNLQVHNVGVEEAHTGQRCAINLQGLEINDIKRGDTVAHPDTLFPSNRWFVRLHCLPSSPLPIRQRMEVHFHHGTAEVAAKIVFHDREQLEPGQTTIAEVRFLEPLAAIHGDHFVLRAHSPLRTIGGGTVVNPIPALPPRRKEDYAEKLALIEEAGAPDEKNPIEIARKSPTELLAIWFASYPAPGLDTNRLQVLTALPKRALTEALDTLSKADEAFPWDENWWIGKSALEKCLQQCLDRVRELHLKEPMKSSFASHALTQGWGEHLPEKFLQWLLSIAIERGLLKQEGAGLKLATHKTTLDSRSAKIMALITKKIEEGDMTPPFVKEIVEEHHLDGKMVQPILDYLCADGKLVKTGTGIYYSPAALTKIVGKIREWFREHDELEIGDIKSILGISRKYTIPLLEYLDSARITYRVGNKRKLRGSTGS